MSLAVNISQIAGRSALSQKNSSTWKLVVFIFLLTQHHWTRKREEHLRAWHACTAPAWLYLCCIPMNPACRDLTHRGVFSKEIMRSLSPLIPKRGICILATSICLFTSILLIYLLLYLLRGKLQLSWFRHYTTSLKATGSIPDDIIGIFIWPDPSSCNTSLGSSQSLT